MPRPPALPLTAATLFAEACVHQEAVSQAGAQLLKLQSPQGEGLFGEMLQQLGAEHPDTLAARYNLARALLARGEPSPALGHASALFETRQRLLGAGHPYTLDAQLELARTLHAQKDLSAAGHHAEAVLEARRRLLGDEHAHTLDARLSLAAILYTHGDLSGGCSHVEAVLEARRRFQGDEQPHTLAARLKLAGTLQLSETFRDQLSKLERRLSELPGARDPAALTARLQVALLFFAEGKLSEAVKQQLPVLGTRIDLLGGDHPDTLTAQSHLAATLFAQGDLSGALSHQHAVLEARQSKLEYDHPDTLNARVHLTATLLALGNLAGALSHGQAALEPRLRLLGNDHPDTLTARLNLARILLAGAREHQQAARVACNASDVAEEVVSREEAVFAEMDLKLDDMCDHQEQLLGELRGQLGGEHPHTVLARINLAQTMHASKNLDVSHERARHAECLLREESLLGGMLLRRADLSRRDLFTANLVGFGSPGRPAP